MQSLLSLSLSLCTLSTVLKSLHERIVSKLWHVDRQSLIHLLEGAWWLLPLSIEDPSYAGSMQGSVGLLPWVTGSCEGEVSSGRGKPSTLLQLPFSLSSLVFVASFPELAHVGSLSSVALL